MDQEQPFDSDICAQLYSRLIRIGFDGAQRSLHGHRLRTSWFNTCTDHPEAVLYVPQWRTRFPAPIDSLLEQNYLVIDTHGVPIANDVLAYHAQAIPPPTCLQPVKIEDLDDCVLLLSDNLSAMMDSIGLVMDLSNLRVSYIHDRLSRDENENQPWYDLQLFLERLNDITDVEKYRPIPSDNNMYNPYWAMANFWSVVPWNDRVLEQSIGARLP